MLLNQQIRKDVGRLGNSLQHGCCGEGPMDGFTPFLLPYQQQSAVLTEAAAEAYVKSSTA